MVRNCFVLTSVFVAVLFFTACGSDGSKEASALIESQADITENYVNGLLKAENADDVVAVVEEYTKGMKEVFPKLDELYKKHPEFTQGETPEKVTEALKRLEEATEKLPSAMMKLTPHMMDPKVQQAMVQMGNEMGKLNQ